MLAVLLMMTAACAAPGPSQPAGAPPTTPPLIEGRITNVDIAGRRISVDDVDGNNKAVVTVTDQTRMVEEFGGGYEPSSLAQFATGQTVAVWTSGPVRESFPVQADADVIVVREP